MPARNFRTQVWRSRSAIRLRPENVTGTPGKPCCPPPAAPYTARLGAGPGRAAGRSWTRTRQRNRNLEPAGRGGVPPERTRRARDASPGGLASRPGDPRRGTMLPTWARTRRPRTVGPASPALGWWEVGACTTVRPAPWPAARGPWAPHPRPGDPRPVTPVSRLPAPCPAGPRTSSPAHRSVACSLGTCNARRPRCEARALSTPGHVARGPAPPRSLLVAGPVRAWPESPPLPRGACGGFGAH
jgi:hypothetical protein